MDFTIELLRGPLFLVTFSFMVLGLLRELLLILCSSLWVYRRAGDTQIDARRLFRLTARWVLPIRSLCRHPGFVINSMLFHIAVIVVPLFLPGHIAIWERSTGISWIGLPDSAADGLTILAIATTLLFGVYRLARESSRQNTQLADLLILLAVVLPFLTGFCLMHPAWTPFPFHWNLLLHLLSAEVLFVLIPTSKLRHMILFPLLQPVSELGWHWPRNSGSQVGLALGKKGVQP